MVKNIGGYAITVESGDVIVSLEEIGRVEYLKNPLLNKKIVSNTGALVGITTDFTFDPTTGNLTSLEFKKEKSQEAYTLSFKNILTVGNDFIISDEGLKTEEPLKSGSENISKANTIEQRAINYASGKRASYTVRDGQGGVIVVRGEKNHS